jgi:phytoene dehydrogenase-like protein
MYDTDVIVIGAGLTGLRAAMELSTAGASVIVIERSSSVGGRVKTIVQDGCLLDKGFQVIHTAYPELSRLDLLPDLNLKAFTAGARIQFSDGSRPTDILSPIHHPLASLRALVTRDCSVGDLLKCAPIVLPRFRKQPRLMGISFYKLLQSKRFTERFHSGFLKPMLRGVLLDELLKMDAGIALYFAHIICSGRATLPRNGIQALPDLLATKLGSNHILLNTSVRAVSQNEVELENGGSLTAKHIVCATDSLTAATFGGDNQTVPYNGTTTLYFKTSEPPFRDPLLVLSGDGLGPVNNIAVPTNVHPNYTNDSSSLIAASVIGRSAILPLDTLLPRVRLQMSAWFGRRCQDWELIKEFRIPIAIPGRPRCGPGWEQRNGIYYAGDYLSYGSHNGALQAGRLVARHILANFF